jgi:hypothetical protein
LSVLAGTLFGTTAVFATYLLIASVMIGLGLAVRRAFGLRDVQLADLLASFWMGLASTLSFLTLWNFALPVASAATVLVLGAGLASMCMMRARIGRALRSARLPRWMVFGLALLGLWIANVALGPMRNWDTSLYHMQGVEWAKQHAAVPGLANLFGPLGFNNSTFLYDALLDAGPWRGRAWHVANGVMLWVFAAQALCGTVRIATDGARVGPMHVVALALLPLATAAIERGSATDFSTAVPGGFLLAVAFQRCVRASALSSWSDGQRAFELVSAVVLAASAVAAKLSNAVFAAALVLVAGVALLRSTAQDNAWRRRALLWTCGALALIGGGFAARGVVLSGYPLFPSRVLAAPVEWRAPDEHARAEYDFVGHSARATADDPEIVSGARSGWQAWSGPWLASLGHDPFTVAVPLGVAVIAALLLVLRRRVQAGALAPPPALLVPPALALVAWFVVAPMPHYGAPFVWTLFAVAVSHAFARSCASPSASRRWAAALTVLGASPCIVLPLVLIRGSSPSNPLRRIASSNCYLPKAGTWIAPTPALPTLTTYTTRSGLALNVPSGELARSWSAPLPCTPNPASNLRLRRSGRLGSGFVVDGAWQMEHWPEPWRPNFLPALRDAWRRRRPPH